MTPTQTWPAPAMGRIVFYVRTDLGMLTADVTEKELHAGFHPLSPLYFAGNAMSGEIRKTSQARWSGAT